MTAVLLFLSIRAAHVLVAALWIGSTVFSAALLMPALEGSGPAAGVLMGRLNRRGFPVYMSIVGATTMLSGVYLLWHFTGGFDSSVMTSREGLVFGAGGLAGILAGIIGGAVVGRSARALSHLLDGQITEADDHVHRALLSRAATLRNRMKIGTRAVIVLQMIALVFMSVGHYV